MSCCGIGHHNLCHPGLLTILTEGKTDGKICVGRKRLEYIDQIVNYAGCGGYTEMNILFQNRYAGELHQTG